MAEPLPQAKQMRSTKEFGGHTPQNFRVCQAGLLTMGQDEPVPLTEVLPASPKWAGGLVVRGVRRGPTLLGLLVKRSLSTSSLGSFPDGGS